MNIKPFFYLEMRLSPNGGITRGKEGTNDRIKFEVLIRLLASFLIAIANKITFFATVCLVLIILFNVVAPPKAIA